MPTPSARSRPMTLNSSSISASLSAAVGSSMISTCESCEMALTISTICCRATVSFETGVSGSISRFICARSSAVRRFISFSFRNRRKALRGSRPMKMFWATVRSCARLSSWWIMVIPIRCAARVSGICTSRPRKKIFPSSFGYTPVSTFIRVDLPAPFSPTSACTSPAFRSKRALFNACTPAKRFSIPSIRTSSSVKISPPQFVLSAAGFHFQVTNRGRQQPWIILL